MRCLPLNGRGGGGLQACRTLPNMTAHSGSSNSSDLLGAPLLATARSVTLYFSVGRRNNSVRRSSAVSVRCDRTVADTTNLPSVRQARSRPDQPTTADVDVRVPGMRLCVVVPQSAVAGHRESVRVGGVVDRTSCRLLALA